MDETSVTHDWKLYVDKHCRYKRQCDKSACMDKALILVDSLGEYVEFIC